MDVKLTKTKIKEKQFQKTSKKTQLMWGKRRKKQNKKTTKGRQKHKATVANCNEKHSMLNTNK